MSAATASTEQPQYPALPPVTDAYRKAHKNYVLAGALLGSWQLIGISIDTKGKWGITLKSPAAVPLILFALVVYFGYKMTVEWLQCDEGRRMHTVALLDFKIAHGIALSAVIIAIFQYTFQKQVLDVILTHVPLWVRMTALSAFMLSFMTAVTFLVIAIYLRVPRQRHPRYYKHAVWLIVVSYLLALAIGGSSIPRLIAQWPSALSGATVTAVFIVLAIPAARLWAKFAMQKR